MVSEPTTGVAADAGNVLGGGCPVNSVCPSSLTVAAPGTGTYPGTQLKVNPLGFQVQHTPPPPTSAAPRIPLSAKSALA